MHNGLMGSQSDKISHSSCDEAFSFVYLNFFKTGEILYADVRDQLLDLLLSAVSHMADIGMFSS